MRLPFMKKYNIEEFEFSQSYLFFWDKVQYYRPQTVLGMLMQLSLSNGTEFLLSWALWTIQMGNVREKNHQKFLN